MSLRTARRLYLQTYRIRRHQLLQRRSLTVTRPRRLPPNNMTDYFETMLSWLRTPFLAASGLSVVLSSLLYFKQTYARQ